MMRRAFGFAILACGVLTGCGASQAPVPKTALLGTYVYKAQSPKSKVNEHAMDHLVLRPDGRYDFVQGGTSGTKTETVGSWALLTGGIQGQVLDVGLSEYPIKVADNEVRLMIDNDVDAWYEKVQ